MTMTKCSGNRPTEDIGAHIATLSDHEINYGLERHADPQFWKDNVRYTAYLRKWGCILRREARRRGLL